MKFWNFRRIFTNLEQTEFETELRIEGEIASESWWGDEVTPDLFRAELNKHPGDITVWINSPGGDVFAASVIYTALKEHKGSVTVKVDGIAFSAASVIAMAGDRVLMSPTSYMMIHQPWTIALGDSDEFRQVADFLDEISEGIINAYQLKTGMQRETLMQLMKQETYMNAMAAVEYGLADAMLYAETLEEDEDDDEEDDLPVASGIASGVLAGLRPSQLFWDDVIPQRGVVFAKARSTDAMIGKMKRVCAALQKDDGDARKRLELRMKLSQGDGHGVQR